MNTPVQRIAVTAGEPAGIGPDLIVSLAQISRDCEIVIIGDAKLLAERARQLGHKLRIRNYNPEVQAQPAEAGSACIANINLNVASEPGKLNPANSSYVLETLARAADGCLSGEFAAVVTAPVQKSVIAETGTPFSGHTEYFAEVCGSELPVMLLCANDLRVALLTTHLPLSAVPAQVTQDRIVKTCTILHSGLRSMFGISEPRIAVLGLNPHAGEHGQLGSEDQNEIEPAVAQMRAAGLNVTGPLPADSAFTPDALQGCDAVLAMYHDQGLPVLKHAGFGSAVNITLGLPIVRTSVDHGTALTLAGSGNADSGSMEAALKLAQEIAGRVAAP